MARGLTKEQELVVSVLATARSKGVEIFITLEAYHILTRILRNPPVARAIIGNTDVLYRSKPFDEWLRDVRDVTRLTKEDANVLAYAAFGTNVSGTIMGCEKVITLDKGLANVFELRKDELETKLGRLTNRLPFPYQKARLPRVVLLQTE